MNVAATNLVLDNAAMAPLWEGVPRLRRSGVADSTFASLWIKPGRHFNVCYRLTPADGSAPLWASACAMDAAVATKHVERAGSHRSAAGDDCQHCAVGSVSPGVFLQTFPFDYRMSSLAPSLEVQRVEARLPPDWRLNRTIPIGYRPGMRCTVAYAHDETARAYGKVQVEREPGQGFRTHQTVHAELCAAACPGLVPPPLFYVDDLRLAVTAAVPGDSLYDRLRLGRGDALAGVVAAGRALARLHVLSAAAVERVYGVDDEMALVRSWIDLLAELDPRRRLTLLACIAELAARQPPPGEARAFVHRDFHDKQVLLDGARTTLLDLDTACHGDAEIDLGNFCAHLKLRRLQWGGVALHVGDGAAFLAAYERPIDRRRLDWYRRMTLLRLACVYALRPPWSHLSAPLLDAVLADEVPQL